jgi:hypothetical protein
MACKRALEVPQGRTDKIIIVRFQVLTAASMMFRVVGWGIMASKK